MCQSFQIVALCSHYLHNCLNVFYHLMVLFWKVRWCTVYVLHCRVVPPFSRGFYRSFLLSVRLVKNKLYLFHVLRSVNCCLHYQMLLLKIPVCAKRVIPFDIIMALDIVWPPYLANYLPFSNCSIIQSRGPAGSYGPIILTAFSSRFISLIASSLENRC